MRTYIVLSGPPLPIEKIRDALGAESGPSAVAYHFATTSAEKADSVWWKVNNNEICDHAIIRTCVTLGWSFEFRFCANDSRFILPPRFYELVERRRNWRAEPGNALAIIGGAMGAHAFATAAIFKSYDVNGFNQYKIWLAAFLTTAMTICIVRLLRWRRWRGLFLLSIAEIILASATSLANSNKRYSLALLAVVPILYIRTKSICTSPSAQVLASQMRKSLSLAADIQRDLDEHNCLACGNCLQGMDEFRCKKCSTLNYQLDDLPGATQAATNRGAIV